jgi:hypothetical protein
LALKYFESGVAVGHVLYVVSRIEIIFDGFD